VRFDVFRCRRGILMQMRWCWQLRNERGRVIATSHVGYDNRADCLNAVDEIRRKAADVPIKGIE
jgi:uncharacterized protein YegP (UPF0339 family)